MLAVLQPLVHVNTFVTRLLPGSKVNTSNNWDLARVLWERESRTENKRVKWTGEAGQAVDCTVSADVDRPHVTGNALSKWHRSELRRVASKRRWWTRCHVQIPACEATRNSPPPDSTSPFLSHPGTRVVSIVPDRTLSTGMLPTFSIRTTKTCENLMYPMHSVNPGFYRFIKTF